MSLKSALRKIEAIEQGLGRVVAAQEAVNAAFDKATGPSAFNPGLQPLVPGRPSAAAPGAGGGGGGGSSPGGASGGGGAEGITGIDQAAHFANLRLLKCVDAEISIPHPRAIFRLLGRTIKIKGLQCPFSIDGQSFFPFPGQLQPAGAPVSGRSSGSAGSGGTAGGGGGFDPNFVPSPGGGGADQTTNRLAGNNPTEFGGSNEGAPDSEAPDDTSGDKNLVSADGRLIAGEIRGLRRDLRIPISAADDRSRAEGNI